ncbi:MAG: FHA domain-containing protein [Bdellovibrionales bacterium]|nr:FHA domain-containing protein [Bdellovibrionales bacterium]
MLAIRIVSGPQTGAVIPLNSGTATIGRSEDCSFQLVSPGVSKQHAKIEVLSGKIIISDLDSKNGTFVNGVQIRNKSLKEGDRIALHDVLMELIDTEKEKPLMVPPPNIHYPPQFGNVAYQHQPFQQPSEAQYHPPSQGSQLHMAANNEEVPQNINANEFMTMINNYVEDVVLPGVYRLPQYLEFKWVLGIFMAGFIILVTALSTIPLLRILKTSIERESQEHALTIAKHLADDNLNAIGQGLNTAVSVAGALKRPGVVDALVISNVDGSIIAPASKAGSYPDIAFVHDARKRGKEAVAQVDSDTVVALAPLEFFNAETGSRGITAYSVVVYDMGSLAVDDGKTLSLFIQTLFIGLLIGGILFFFLYKMIEYPLKSMNLQLNDALKSGGSHITIDYDFPVLQNLASNISSALTRTSDSGSSNAMTSFEPDRTHEMNNLVELIGFGSLTINGNDRTISAMNAVFQEKSHMNLQDSLYMSVNEIPDQALKLSLIDLLERVDAEPDQIITNELEFNGESYQLAAQAVQGSQGISYYVIVLLPNDGGYDE